MSRWKPLPAELDPGVRQLVVRLRRLKDHSGLSVRQLAARTGHSPKSWERYLGGRSLPPADAVEAMARIGGEDPVRLLALHEVAAAPRADARPGPLEPEEPEETPAPAPEGRALRIALVAGAVAVVLAVSAAVLLAVRLTGGGSEPAAAPLTPSTASAPPSPPSYICRTERIDGRWYAGISRTQDRNLANGYAGPEVAEAQCLLRRAGVSPGGIDGIFGPLTQQAVETLQRRAGLVVDGLIGPHTWKALRG